MGNKTDIAYNDVFDSMQQFDALGLDYEFDGVNPDAGHNWNAWQENLIDFAPRLFHGKDAGDSGFSEGHTALEERFDLPAPGTTPTPCITEDGFVTFETTTDFADAEYVSVWANWAPGGSWLRVEMTKVGDRWRATVGPLDPWFYYYRLIVDRQSVKDTSNPTKVTSEPAWSTFFIAGRGVAAARRRPRGRGRKPRGADLPEHGRRPGAERVRLDASGLRPRPGRALPAVRAEPRRRAELDGLGRGRAAPGRSSTTSTLRRRDRADGRGDAQRQREQLSAGAAGERDTGSGCRVQHQRRSRRSGRWPDCRPVVRARSSVLKANPGAFAYIGTFAAGFGGTPGIDVAAINEGTELYRIYTGDITDFTYLGDELAAGRWISSASSTSSTASRSARTDGMSGRRT